MFCCKKRNTQKFEYNIPMDLPPVKGESPIYRNPLVAEKDIFVCKPGITNLQEFWDYNFATHKKKSCLGNRKYTLLPDQMRKEKHEKSSVKHRYSKNSEDLGYPPLNDYFSFMTYETVEKKIKQIGSGITNLNLAPELNEFEDWKVKFIGIYAKTSIEWFLIDIACSYYGFSVVPIYDTQGGEAIKTMFEQTNFSTLFLTCSHLQGIIDNFNKGHAGKLKNLVIIDSEELEYFPAKYAPVMEQLETLEGNDKLSVMYLKDILEAGENLVKAPKLSPDTLWTLSYTSGSTSTPKGAMITHRNIVANATFEGSPFKEYMNRFDGEKRSLSYLPLAHVMARAAYVSSCFSGTAMGVFCGDIQKIREDCCILKPTSFGSAPRFFNRIADLIKDNFDKAGGLKGTLIRWGVETKLKNLKNNGSLTHWFYDALIFNKIKNILGGEITMMAIGSAPMSKDVMAFLRICFCCPIMEGYGQTECTGSEMIQHYADTMDAGYVGGVLSMLEFKLKDVPEMNYFTSNLTEDGKPYPQGEILVRGSTVVAGYYKNRELYDQTVDKDGWLHSGDIGELGPNRSLKIIDRAKNIFKLSQGEYIAPDRLAEIYKSARSVMDIFVYGESLKSTLVGMIHPEINGLKELAKKNGIEAEGDIRKLCESDKLKAQIIQDLKQVAITNGLKGFEHIKAVHLTPKTFSELGLLTDMFKVKRKETENYFKDKINELYKKLD